MTGRAPILASALIADSISALGIPGGALAGASFQIVLERIQTKRLDVARSILLSEIRRGDRFLSDPEIEEWVYIYYRYFRAAHEGAAHRNLRLMARVIAGQIEFRSLFADEFLRYADILATLRREEVVLLATVCRFLTDPETTNEDKKHGKAFAMAGPVLIPSLFRTDQDFEAVAASLTRTGYIVPTPALGGMNYGITAAFEALNKLARLDTLSEADMS
jgi:hypothetical protein